MKSISTPWGPSQSVRLIAEGITFVSTSGHGGIILSPERWEELQAALPGFQPWAGNVCALEEDCDANAARLVWPQFFDDRQIYNSVRFAQGSVKQDDTVNAAAYRAFLSSDAGAIVRGRADDFSFTIADKWESGGMSTQGNGWIVFLRRGDVRKAVWMPDYPSAQFFSDAELAALPPEPKKPEPKRPPRAPSQVHFDESQCGGECSVARIVKI